MKRLVEGRRHLRDWSIPDMPPLALDGGQAAAAAAADAAKQEIDGMRGRLARITQTAAQPAAPAPARGGGPGCRLPLGIPPADGQALLQLIAVRGQVTAKEAAGGHRQVQEPRRGVPAATGQPGDRSSAAGSSRASRYGFAGQPAPQPRPEEPAPDRPDGYVTIEALADAVHQGLVDVDDDTRAVLEQVRQIRDRAAGARICTSSPDPESDAS